jgi:hypothetical protein
MGEPLEPGRINRALLASAFHPIPLRHGHDLPNRNAIVVLICASFPLGPGIGKGAPSRAPWLRRLQPRSRRPRSTQEPWLLRPVGPPQTTPPPSHICKAP